MVTRAFLYVHFLYCLIILILISGCSKNSEDYYPLKEGRSWEYQVSSGGMFGSSGGATIIITNFAPRDLKGKKVIPQKIDAMGQSDFSFVVQDDTGIYVYATQFGQASEPEIHPSPVYYLRDPIQVGTNWEYTTDTSLLMSKVSLVVKSTIKNVNEVVTVPAGTFEKCVRVETAGKAKKNLGGIMGTAKINVEGINWYAPGVGLIKSIIKEKSNNLMMGSGEVTLQLKSFKK